MLFKKKDFDEYNMLCSSRSSKISLRDFDISDLFAFNVLLPRFAPSFHGEWFSNATFSKRPSLASQSKRASKLLLSAFVESFSCLIFFFSEYLTQCYIFIHLIVCFTFTRIIGLELCDVHH